MRVLGRGDEGPKGTRLTSEFLGVGRVAGVRSALLFWTEVSEHGPALANPELFPWTLANAACGWLAREYSITGPSLTCTGAVEALTAALNQAQEDLDAGRVTTAFVVAVDFATSGRGRTRFGALRLSRRSSGAVVRATGAGESSADRTRAATALGAVIAAVDAHATASLSDGFSRWTFSPT